MTANEPIRQLKQPEVPEYNTYVPAAQLEHEVASAAEYIPATQELQLEDAVPD